MRKHFTILFNLQGKQISGSLISSAGNEGSHKFPIFHLHEFQDLLWCLQRLCPHMNPSRNGVLKKTTTFYYFTGLMALQDEFPIRFLATDPQFFIIDSGASLSITPYKSDFIKELQMIQVLEVKSIASRLSIDGMGLVEY